MRALSECFSCVLTQAWRNLEEWDGSEYQKFEAMIRSVKNLGSAHYGMKPIELSKLVNDSIKEFTGIKDFYVFRKKKLNDSALRIVSDVVEMAQGSSNPLKTLAIAAILGNHLDFGVKDVELDRRFVDLVRFSTLAVDDFSLFVDKLLNAKILLYVLDNTGEVVFDKAFIDRIENDFDVEVKVAVRSAPIINDVTKEDALYVGFSENNIIESGTTMAGMSLDVASKEFISMWNKADLIISKGQGNFEGLEEVHDKRLFFFLKAKCSVVAKMIGIKVGEMVLKNWK